MSIDVPTVRSFDQLSLAEPVLRALNDVGYDGPLSIEWEDMGMNRDQGAPEALAMVRRLDLTPSDVAFDAAFAAE